MRQRFNDVVEAGREHDGPYASNPGERKGRFRLTCPCTGEDLVVLASDGADWRECQLPGRPWQHVSVSAKARCPTWQEMCWVEELFFNEEEVVVQLHPPRSQWVNIHPFTLHLWRPVGQAIPLPPRECV